MNSKPPHSKFPVRIAIALAICSFVWPPAGAAVQPGALASAQTSLYRTGSEELEQLLFVQAPENGIPKGGIVLVWLPEPLQKLCLGKTASRCAAIDYCIRTTNRNVPMCRNLSVNLARLSPYPPSTRPRRMISLTLSGIRAMNGNGFDLLQSFYNTAPRASLERLSMDARVQARIRFTRKPDDDDFNLLQVVAVAPF